MQTIYEAMGGFDALLKSVGTRISLMNAIAHHLRGRGRGHT